LKEGKSECYTRKKTLKKSGIMPLRLGKFVREGKDYYGDGLNNPAAFKLIGNIKDKRSYSRSGKSS